MAVIVLLDYVHLCVCFVEVDCGVFFGWPGRAVRGDKLFRAPLPPGAVPECNIGAQGKYLYLSDLLALKSADSDRPHPFPSLPEVCDAGFALRPRWLVWVSFLRRHPDPEFAAFILRGVVLGFRIGCAASDQPVLSCRNMRSAGENPHVVANYLEAELLAGRLVRVDPSADLRVHLSPFGVIPKRGQPDKWRLINDLSAPVGRSVNDGIDQDLCSIRYASLDAAVSMVRAAGVGTHLAKLDLRHAYRMVPVHPRDRLLLGMSWQGSLLVDTALPFGLRSAPKLFSALADAVLWAMLCRGVPRASAIHYLDDFLLTGSETSCAESLDLALAVCSDLGMPVAEEKLEGSATRITFLGIVIDTELLQLSLPGEKLACLRALLAAWRQKRSATKRELLSLIGHLQHAASIVKPGRSFLRHLIDLASTVRKLHHHVHLRVPFRSDLTWWELFVERWNGLSLIAPALPPLSFVSDASGSWGCGAAWQERWLQWQRPPRWRPISIAAKEMAPVVLAVATWGACWRGRVVRVLCDNSAVVFAINAGRARDKLLMHLLRCLYFFCAHHCVTLVASHIQGAVNRVADAISRNHLDTFRSLVPQALPLPSVLRPSLCLLLLETSLTWTSPRWRQLFLCSLEGAWPTLRPDPTQPDRGASSASAAGSACNPSQ